MNRLRKQFGLVVAAIGLMAAALVLAAPARADDTNINFVLDQGVIKMSDTWAEIIDPDLTPPDNPAKFSASVAEDGTLNVPASSFSFPTKTIENLETGNDLLPFVDAKIEIEAAAALTGSFDLGSGAATVRLPTFATITVYSAGSPASVAKCTVSGFDIDLATTGSMVDPGDAGETPPRPAHTYEAGNFTPPGGAGSLVASWPGLPAADEAGGSLGGIVCPALDDMIGGPGGLWLDGTALPGEAPVPPDPPDPPDPPVQNPPVAVPGIINTPAASTEQTDAEFTFAKGAGETEDVTGFNCRLDSAAWAACDDGTATYTGLDAVSHTFQVKAKNEFGEGPVATHAWTIIRPTPLPRPSNPMFSRVVIKPKIRVARRGQRVVFGVRVKNVGNAPVGGVRICALAPRRLVRVRRCIGIGRLNAKQIAGKRFRVAVNRRARRGQRAILRFRVIGRGIRARQSRAMIRVR